MSLEKDLTTAAEISRKLSGSPVNPIAASLEKNSQSALVANSPQPHGIESSSFGLLAKFRRLGQVLRTLPRAPIHIDNLLAENHKRKIETDQHQRQIDELLNDINHLRAAMGRLSQVPTSSRQGASEQTLSPLWDHYYRAFEDRFRGSETSIQEKQSQYVAQIQSRLSAKALVVDLGCGRGEWLKLLKVQGFQVLGVDSNDAMIKELKGSGVSVIHQNALSWLADQPSESVDMITAFHVVEHLAPNELLQMLAEIARVLKKSGLVLLETPNPENLIVGACNFWTDITHVKPIPPQTLGFMLDFLGFTQLECIRSSPPREGANPQNPLEAPQDYAILSQKR
jgi:O-antigen chain-terminating methyltransferase